MGVPVSRRLLQALNAAGVPATGVDTDGNVAPPELQAQAQPVIDAFDWSPAAHAAWEADRRPERRDLRASADQAVADLDTFLALSNPSNVQNAAAVRRLAQMMRAVIRRLIQLD